MSLLLEIVNFIPALSQRQAIDALFCCVFLSVKGKVAWTEEQEQELRDLYERFENHEEPGRKRNSPAFIF